jgi:hypothetical protein
MALKELLTDLSKFKYTNYENVGANNSQIGGRHSGVKPGESHLDAKHPETHTKFDDGVGRTGHPQYAGVKGRGYIPFPEGYNPNNPVGGWGLHKGGVAPHDEAHSLYDDGLSDVGHPQSFTVRGYTVSDVISGRHGGIEGPTPAQPPHPDDHSIHDDGVGFGVAPSDNPQTFDVRGYTVTGNKRFYIGWQGDIMNHSLSDYGIGAFDSLAGVFDHTQTRDKLRKAYENYDSIEFGVDGSVHVGDQDLAGVVGGGLSYYGSLVPIIPRGSIYRNSEGQYQVPQEGRNTNPPGGISGIPLFDGTQITFNIPQHTSTGPTQFTVQPLNTIPFIENAHGSDFMTTPIGDSVLPSNTVTHNVDMITLSGPTSQTYQTQLNITPIADGAHGSDFQTTPIEAYSSIFATQDGLLMDTIYDSGFNRGDMYITDHPHQSHPEFGEFNRTEKSLNRIELDSPNFDSDGNKEFTFKDRAPYNIPARDNTVFGFDQPFILKDIGDKWGPGGLGAVDEGIFRGGFVTSAARTVADVLRIGKFILTPKGIMFGLKQFGLQLLNPRKETTIWNPLSLVGSVAPMVHMDRHFGTATEGFGYESVINFGLASTGKRMNSILFTYGSAVNLPGGNIPAIAAVTATRVTGAHLVGMVPSAGGVPGTIPSIPEIDIDLSGGNITSLTIGTNKYGPKTLLGNKEYTTSDGTPIIPARNPEAGFKSGILGGRFAGSPFTTMFLNEDGLFPSEALTDAVKKENVFQGQFILPGETSATEPGSYSSLFKVLEGPYKSLFGVTEQSIGEVVFVGKPGLIGGKPAVQPFLSYNVKVGSGIGPTISIYNPLIPEGERGVLQGFNQGSGLVYDPLNKDYPAELQIGKPDIFQGNLYESDNTYSKGFVFHGTAEDGFKNLGLVESIFDDDIIRKTSQTDTVPGVAQLISFHNIGQGPTIESGNGLVAGVGKSVNYPFHDYIYRDGFEGDLYDKDNKYTKNISIDETQSSPLTKTRLRIDGDKDPVVQIQTAHLNTARFNVDGKTTLSSPIKLQNFPLFNNQSGGNLGSEKQSLGFIDESGTPLHLADSLYGHQWNVDKRTETTKLKYKDSIKSVPETDEENLRGIVNEGRFGLTNKNIPKVNKKIFTVNDTTDADVILGDNEVESFIVQGIHERTAESNKSGNLLDRYKTLAYGQLPKQGESTEENRYDKKENKSPVKEGDTTSLSTVKIVSDDDLGLIKKTSADDKYATDLTDSVNMTKYGDDNDEDYIKFKIYDLVNKKYIIFRAFLSGISETLSPEWSSERYIGRPDSVHVYQGVERSMSFEFMIVPNSKQELPILWEKLNYLVGLTYPTWKSIGTTGKRMEAPFIQLTMGDLYNSVPGYFSSLSITVDDQSPWELDNGFQLPHALNVSCEFTHIGQHALASQGTHFDFGGEAKSFLKPYNVEDGTLGARKQLTALMGT